MFNNHTITMGVSFYTCEKIDSFFTLSYNAVSFETLAQSRWPWAVDSPPAPEPLIRRRLRGCWCVAGSGAVRVDPALEPWVRSRLQSHWCAPKHPFLFGSNTITKVWMCVLTQITKSSLTHCKTTSNPRGFVVVDSPNFRTIGAVSSDPMYLSCPPY